MTLVVMDSPTIASSDGQYVQFSGSGGTPLIPLLASAYSIPPPVLPYDGLCSPAWGQNFEDVGVQQRGSVYKDNVPLEKRRPTSDKLLEDVKRIPSVFAEEVEDVIAPIKGKYLFKKCDRRLARLARVCLARLLYDTDPWVARETALAIVKNSIYRDFTAYQGKRHSHKKRVGEILTELDRLRAEKDIRDGIESDADSEATEAIRRLDEEDARDDALLVADATRPSIGKHPNSRNHRKKPVPSGPPQPVDALSRPGRDPVPDAERTPGESVPMEPVP